MRYTCPSTKNESMHLLGNGQARNPSARPHRGYMRVLCTRSSVVSNQMWGSEGVQDSCRKQRYACRMPQLQASRRTHLATTGRSGSSSRKDPFACHSQVDIERSCCSVQRLRVLRMHSATDAIHGVLAAHMRIRPARHAVRAYAVAADAL